jgi:hypothetical protein
MNFWTLLLLGAGVIQAIGLFAFLLGVFRAPTGCQDEAGFHLTAESELSVVASRELSEMDTGKHALPPFGHAA